LDSYKQVGLFIDALAAHGLVVGRDVGILANGETCPGTIFLQDDYVALSVEVMRIISELVAVPDRSLGRVVLSDFIKRTPMKIEDVPQPVSKPRCTPMIRRKGG